VVHNVDVLRSLTLADVGAEGERCLSATAMCSSSAPIERRHSTLAAHS